MHDAITLGIPVLAIFFGILLNQRGLAEFKADVKSDMTELKSNLKSDINRLESKIDHVQADLLQFNRDLGRHDFRLDNLESKSA
jgi:septal ring factor EnvC (AmiA/AmiB activator)